MNVRIGWWALAGFAVACFWVLFALAAGPEHNIGRWTVAAVTAPASFLGRTIPLAVFWSVIANAAIYAAIGLAAELVRWQLRSFAR